MRTIAFVAALALCACTSAPAVLPMEAGHVHGSAPPIAGEASIRATGPAGQTVTLTSADLAAFPRTKIEADFHGEKHIFEGVPLIEILKRAGAPSGDALRGAELTHVVIVTARDGYKVALALAELDPAISPKRVILADRADSAPIPDEDGPFRLVVEGDLKPARSARMVTGVEVRKLD